MGIIYGSMLAFLIPSVVRWSQLSTGLVAAPADVPPFLRWALTVMAVGVFVSGLRDLYAAYELPHGHWPWNRVKV
jgi:hypothetical protein